MSNFSNDIKMDVSSYQPLNTKEKIDALLKEISDGDMYMDESLELEIMFAIKKEKIQRYFKEQLFIFRKKNEADAIIKKYLEKGDSVNRELTEKRNKREKRRSLIEKITLRQERKPVSSHVVKMVTREEHAQIKQRKKLHTEKKLQNDVGYERRKTDSRELPRTEESKNDLREKENEVNISTIFYLEWENVSFHDGYYIFSPKIMIGSKNIDIKPLVVKDSQCLKVYNYITSYFRIKLPITRYRITSKSKIEIIDEIKFRNAILMIKEEYKQKRMWKQLPELDMDKGKPVVYKDFMSTFASMSPILFRKYKSLFIDFLVDKQLRKYRVVPLTESFAYENSTYLSEDAFLFSIRTKFDNIMIVLENVNPNRATLLFVVKEECYMDALKTIYTFMQGDTINKRSKLRAKILSMEVCGIIQYFSINHESFADWRSRVQGFIENNNDVS